jgi:hypothetical protein
MMQLKSFTWDNGWGQSHEDKYIYPFKFRPCSIFKIKLTQYLFFLAQIR